MLLEGGGDGQQVLDETVEIGVWPGTSSTSAMIVWSGGDPRPPTSRRLIRSGV